MGRFDFNKYLLNEEIKINGKSQDDEENEAKKDDYTKDPSTDDGDYTQEQPDEEPEDAETPAPTDEPAPEEQPTDAEPPADNPEPTDEPPPTNGEDPNGDDKNADYTQDNPEGEEPATDEPAPEDDTDYTKEQPDDTGENTDEPVDNTDNTGGAPDPTLDGGSADGGDNPDADGTGGDVGGDPNTGGDATAGGGGAEPDDYTQEQPDGVDGESDPNSNGTDDPNANAAGDDATDNGVGTPDELQTMENDMFSDLTPEQINIKHIELKQQFIELYSVVDKTIDRVDKIGRTEDNLRPLEFVAKKLLELRDLIRYNLTVSYPTKTYIENEINLQHAMSIYNTLEKIMEQLARKKEDK